MKALAITLTTLRRTLRERSSIFFLVLFPMLLILVLGMAFGGSYTPKVGLVQPSSAFSLRLSDALRAADGMAIRPVADERALMTAVERGELEAGVILPADTTSPVKYVIRPGLQGQQVGSIIVSVLDDQASGLRAVRFVQRESGLSLPQAQESVDALDFMVESTAVTVTNAGASPATEDRFGGMAVGELLLFVFLAAMTSSVAVVESRRLGIARRMLATPTSAHAIVRGEALARLSVSLLQAALIMVGASLLFQVNWGDPLAAGLLIVAFACVASSIALVVGALVPTSEMAIGTGLLLALGMAALGGAMMPLEFFSERMRAVAHLTPHAWAADGFATLTQHGGTTADVLSEIGILFGAAMILFGFAAWLLRRRLAR